MSKKGFTLIELLGTIILLAIIALIATVVINSVITSSKKQTFVVSTNELLKKLQLDRSENSITIPNSYSVDSSGVKEVSSERVINFKHVEGITGTITFDDLGNYTFLLKNDKYCTRKNSTDREIKIFDILSAECS